eukprot:11834356-Alexandrium_andersonii.AAC.1
MRNCLGGSKLELRGPRSGPRIDPHCHGAARSVPFLVQTPNPPTKRVSGRAGGADRGGPGGGAPWEDL